MKRGVLIIFSGIVVLLVASFTVYALLTRQSTEVVDKTLSVYMPFDEVDVYKKITSDFAAANPNIDLEFKYIEAKDAKEYEAKVVNDIANGEGPDIWLVRSDWIPKHAAKSIAFEPTSDQPDPIASAKTVIEPAIVDINTYDGKLYGVPLFADSLAIIYNLDMYRDVAAKSSEGKKLENAATTWDIFKEQSGIVTNNSGSVISRSAVALGTIETMYAPVDVFSAMLVQYGASLFSNNGDSVTFNLAQFKDGVSTFPSTSALDLFTSFSNSKASNYSWNNDLGEAVQAFKSQKTGAIIGYYSLFNSLNNSGLGFDLGVGPLPQVSEKAKRVDYGVSWSFIVNSQTNKAIKSQDLASYMSLKNVQDSYSAETGRLPTYNSGESLELEVVEGEGVKNIFSGQLPTITGIYKVEWQAVDEALQDTVKLVTNLSQSPQAAVDSIALKLKDLIK